MCSSIGSAVVSPGDARPSCELSQVLEEHRRARPAQLAVVGGDVRLSYSELAVRVGALAAALDARGFGQGDRLLWLGGGSFRLLECLLAVARLGGVMAPVGQRDNPELNFILRDYAPSVVVGNAAGPPPASDSTWWISRDGDGADGYEVLLDRRRGMSPTPVVIDGAASLLALFTPAVGGRPIGSLVSRAALIAESLGEAARKECRVTNVALNSGHASQISNVVVTVASLLRGTTNVMSSSRESPAAFPAD